MICPHCGRQTPNGNVCIHCKTPTEFARRMNYQTLATADNMLRSPVENLPPQRKDNRYPVQTQSGNPFWNTRTLAAACAILLGISLVLAVCLTWVSFKAEGNGQSSLLAAGHPAEISPNSNPGANGSVLFDWNLPEGAPVFQTPSPVSFGDLIPEPETLQFKSDLGTVWKFTGWNTAQDGSGACFPAKSLFSIPLSGDLTLYAQWREGSSSVPGEDNLHENAAETASPSATVGDAAAAN